MRRARNVYKPAHAVVAANRSLVVISTRVLVESRMIKLTS